MTAASPLPDDPTKHDGSNKPPRELTADIEAFLGEIPGQRLSAHR